MLRSFREENSMTVRPEEIVLPPLLVTPKQAAEVLNIGMTSLYQMITSGKLESVQIGRKRRIKYSSLVALAENGTAVSPAGNSLGLRLTG
jgi:excisionase family DNA binding protein